MLTCVYCSKICIFGLPPQKNPPCVRVFANVVLLLTTVAKTSQAIILIGLLTNGWYVFCSECDCCHHSVVYMPAIKKSKKKVSKDTFLDKCWLRVPATLYLVCGFQFQYLLWYVVFQYSELLRLTKFFIKYVVMPRYPIVLNLRLSCPK